MLLRFGVQNYLSFRDYTEVSLLSTRFTDAPAHRLSWSGAKHGVLPTLAVYGANASGKTNLLGALMALRHEIVTSYVDRKPDQALPHRPFALDPSTETAPTQLDVDFIVGGVRYQYGLRYDARRVVEEWLYAYPSRSRQVWFHRNAEEAEPFYFGSHLKGRKRTLAELTRPNSLFLSAAAQHNQEQLTPIYQWFSQNLQYDHGIRSLGHQPLFQADSPLLDPAHREVVRELLKQADLGVTDFRTHEEEDVIEGMRSLAGNSAFPPELRRQFERMIDNPPLSIELAHRDSQGSEVFLPAELESHGTQLLLKRGERMLAALSRGHLLVIDELDAGLHPHLSAALVGLFTSPEANPRGAQLIFTAHDASLLGAVRRDAILFVEKDRGGGSTFTPLSDFRTRKRDDIRRGYLDGRFGGVPIIGDLSGVMARAMEE